METFSFGSLGLYEILTLFKQLIYNPYSSSTELLYTPSIRVGTYGSATNAQMMSGIDIKTNSVGINASGINFQTYSSGVLSTCTRTGMNHAVVADGYDSTGSEPYWLVRDSVR